MPYFSLAVVLPLISTAIVVVYSVLSRPRWDPRGRVRVSLMPCRDPTDLGCIKHCYITGGSTGLGLALAILLTKRGADVSIVARNEENLKRAAAQLEVLGFCSPHSNHLLTITGRSSQP